MALITGLGKEVKIYLEKNGTETVSMLKQKINKYENYISKSKTKQGI